MNKVTAKVTVVVLCKYKLERIVKWVKLGVYKIYIIDMYKKVVLKKIREPF